ncbi:long-chain fatty acid--CoA ligase [Desulfovibrio sp. X2]|uniref:long-chain-fatty-acid--CoA ligase n=1 Tax=Desulfovibrio sp. X2 TaxID=941449 RepID=UPI000557D5CB|nr:long-chain fatty acid--CoA ligase [Desulfovibrio sp. X2]
MSDAERPWFAHYDPEVPHHLDYEDIPLFTWLDRSADAHPDRTAVIFKNTTLRYGELRRLAEVMAHNLRERGVRRGDRVALMLPNLPQTVIAYWAVLKAGAVVVMVNPLSMEHELVHQIPDSGSRHMITLDLLWPKIAPLRDTLGLDTIHVTTIPDALSFPMDWLARIKLWREKKHVHVPYDGKATVRWRDLVKSSGRYSAPNILPHTDLALLQYTGGTTGRAKGCMITHANLNANVTQIQGILHAVGQHSEVFLGVLPYFHVYGLTVCLNFPISVGATLVPFARFDPRDVLATVNRVRPTIFPGAPSVYLALMQQKEFAEADWSALRYCVSGSAPMPHELLRRFKEITGAEILEGYGLTEASPVTHLNPLNGVRKEGSIGLPFPDTDSRVVDMDGGGPEPLPAGKAGELVIRGPQVMKGYWNRPDETASTLRNGWLYTGDIAVMDEEGYFSIVDRKKDMILVGGYNVYPREIDEVLYAHPKIKEAVAVGIPHRTRGEAIKAFIVPHEGEELTRHEVIAWCREKLASYKVPRDVEFRDELPKTLVGKVLRRALRDEEVARREKSGD